MYTNFFEYFLEFSHTARRNSAEIKSLKKIVAHTLAHVCTTMTWRTGYVNL